ncbi:MAG TPA: Smr/MutS family protein [Candidatus Solibacter sp.]|nr:Smr/MutS family protein [Candidatus Solibacter sp.]
MPRRRPRPWQAETRPRPGPKNPGRVRRVDLHGYDVRTALEVAFRAVQDAYANGYEAVEILHGARDVTSHVAAGEGRGAIKWQLRAMLERGEFNAHVASSEVMEASLRLVLRKNPRPRPERWSQPPPPSRG